MGRSRRKLPRPDFVVILRFTSSGRGFGGVFVRVPRVARDVSSGRRMTGGARGESSRGMFGVASRGVRGECGAARLRDR